MYVDARAIIALASHEHEAERISNALFTAKKRITSPLSVIEAAMALARPDKFDRPMDKILPFLFELLEERGISLVSLPTPSRAINLAIEAAEQFGSGENRINLGGCLDYACAKYYHVPILSTDDQFSQADLGRVA